MAKIYVMVSGGNVQGVYGPKGLEVVMLDGDNLEAMKCQDDFPDPNGPDLEGIAEFEANEARLEEDKKSDEVVQLY